MLTRFSGKIALVTGGGRGIGRAVVQQLALGGAAFIGIHYVHNKAAAEEAVLAVRSLGVQAEALQAQFSPDAHKGAENLWHAFSQAVALYVGRVALDILVNNAGLLHVASLSKSTPTIVKDTLAVNLEAPFYLIQAAAPYLVAGGSIINLSSALTRIADPERAFYSASKAAMESLTLSLAAEFGPRRITVNAVAPGVIDTDMNVDYLALPEARRAAASRSVFARVGEAEEVANLIAYLASSENRWTTGQVIDVSGGTQL
ncbi:MAG: SDR family oxidoreductase [Neisseriaceae bacterium]|nr:SDR family oxidoreductase [Neisseriaceae bacterium]MBP6861062.1 SDR family oxidoreductase [Neisseriaceae bacterium]